MSKVLFHVPNNQQARNNVMVWILNVPKGSCVEGLVTSLRCLLGDGPNRKKLCHWGHASKGDIGTRPLCLSACPPPQTLAPGHHEGSTFTLPYVLHHDTLPCHRPKSNEADWPQTKTSETTNQGKTFLLKEWRVVLPQVFCNSDRKLTQLALSLF
jgi:hypothetical protein